MNKKRDTLDYLYDVFFFTTMGAVAVWSIFNIARVVL